MLATESNSACRDAQSSVAPCTHLPTDRSPGLLESIALGVVLGTLHTINGFRSERVVLKLGTAKRGLVHQPALDDREGGDAFLIAGESRGRRVFLPAACACGCTRRTCAGGRSRRDGDGKIGRASC